MLRKRQPAPLLRLLALDVLHDALLVLLLHLLPALLASNGAVVGLCELARVAGLFLPLALAVPRRLLLVLGRGERGGWVRVVSGARKADVVSAANAPCESR